MSEYFTIGDILDLTYGGVDGLKNLSVEELKRLINMLSGIEHIFDEVCGLGMSYAEDDSPQGNMIREIEDKRIFDYLNECTYLLCKKEIWVPMMGLGDGTYYMFGKE